MEMEEALHSSHTQPQRGKLKIFFGYAAGVGKTYAMLEAAHRAKAQGIDVVVGYVERHTRPDTLALLEGLEQIPPKQVDYKGIMLKEFDLDGALERHPQLLLVDELAHSNAQGCRHAKRYQDVEEVLRSGIDVYTTVNVQHLESLNDLISSITGVVVSERVPDRIFDMAAQVELRQHVWWRLGLGRRGGDVPPLRCPAVVRRAAHLGRGAALRVQAPRQPARGLRLRARHARHRVPNVRGVLNGTGHAKAARRKTGLFPAPADTLLRLPGRTGYIGGAPSSFFFIIQPKF